MLHAGSLGRFLIKELVRKMKVVTLIDDRRDSGGRGLGENRKARRTSGGEH